MTVNKRRHLVYDFVVLLLSTAVSVFFAEVGLAQFLVDKLGGYEALAAFVAGMFFTSMFTTPASIVVLGTLAGVVPISTLVLFGGLGAMVGDYIIFRFIRDRFAQDLAYLFSLTKDNRLVAIFRNKIFRFMTPLVGALIIASPFPDEIGIAMMGVSKLKEETFFLISFVMNSVGVFVIGSVAQKMLGL